MCNMILKLKIRLCEVAFIAFKILIRIKAIPKVKNCKRISIIKKKTGSDRIIKGYCKTKTFTLCLFELKCMF